MICSRTGRGRSWAGAWLSVVLVVVAAAAGLQVRADAAVTPQVRTVCSYARQGLTLLAAHTAAPMWHYAHLFNGTAAAPLQWKMQLLLSSNDGVNISGRLVVQQWLAKGSGCSVLVGSGNADIDSRLVGLVDVPWLEPVLSTAAVVDRKEYPTMLNYLPEKSIAARQFLALLPSRYVSVLSSAHDSSRVWATAATAVFASTNVDVTTVRELTVACDAAAAAAAVQALLALRTRYIFVALTPVQDAGCFANVIQALVAAKATATHVLVFPDDACTLANVYLQSLPGSLCFDYDTTQGLGYGVANGTSNETAYRAAAASYIPRLTALFAGVGITFDPALYTTVRTYYGVLFHDAVVHYMQTAHAMPSRLPAAADLSGGAVTAIGITGALRFDADAVRRSIPIIIYNTLPPLIVSGGFAVLQRRVVGRSYSNGTFEPLAAQIYLLGEEQQATALPAGLTPLPPAATSNTTLIVAVTAGGVILLLLGFAAIFGLRAALAPDPRDNHHAPKDESRAFSIAFTDIQASTTLWAVAPQGMSEAVEQHHALVRELIADHRGYEVKTIGDSFMVAFQDAAAAVRFAVRLQGVLYHAEWPADIDRAYEAMAAEAGLGAGATDAGLWSGLRVRVGVHHGSGSIVLDPTTKGYDYYGTVVNTAARVETVGNGGQVLVTAAALAAAGDDAVEDAVVAGLGAQQLRGLNDAVELHQVVPAEFDGRQFPPLRLDRIDDDDNRDLIHQLSDPDTGGPRTSITKSEHSAFTRSSAPSADSPYAAFLRVLLSPLPAREKGTVLSRLVERWHVPAPTSANALATKEATQAKALVGVAHRAGAAHQQLLHGVSSGRNTDASQCHARRSTDVFHLAPPPTGAGAVGELELSRTRCVSIDSDGLSFRGASGDATGPHALYLSHSSTGVSPKNASGPSTRSPRPDAFPDMGHLPCLPAGSTPRQNAL